MTRLRTLLLIALAAVGFAVLPVLAAGPAHASAPVSTVAGAQVSTGAALSGAVPAAVPVASRQDGEDGSDVTVSVPGRSNVLNIIVLITVLGVAPAVLLLCTCFTKIVVVLSLARSALGTPSIPPNQVLIGLALFISLFIMGPTIDQIQERAYTPYTEGDANATQAYRQAAEPLRDFMLKYTRDEELALMTKAAGLDLPKNRQDVDMRTLIPAFTLSELRSAFIIGFVVFIPFLVIDIVVSAILMSLGMVMLPPSLISLPFKLLLFVLVDGWSLIITTLIGSYNT